MTQPSRSLRRTLGRARRALFVPNELRAQLDRQAQQINALTKTVAGVKEQLKPLAAAEHTRVVEHGRMRVQVGVFEERMGRLEQRLEAGTFVADDAALAEARSLVDEVRQEHQQARVRMQIVSHYEERMRRVEEAVAGLHDGDVRHPV
jgi:chromosome segregation ATPase